MEGETAFRAAVAIILALAMSIGVYYRVRARTDERISRRDEGLLVAVPLRVCGFGVWIATLLYLFYPPAIAWAAVPAPDWPRWLGVPIGLAGTALMYWTMSNLGKNLTDTVVTRRDATLVTAGPYRFVRHPFYVTAALLMLAIVLLSANLLMAFFGLGTIALLAIRTPNEERKLIERFGDGYRDYMARTGRFLPRLSR